MISFTSLWALTLRHLQVWYRDANLLLAACYWPLQDILVWGFVGSWIQQSNSTQFPNYETVTLLSILLWTVVVRGATTIIIAFCEELWSSNIVNLFSLPLRLSEWIAGVILFNICMLIFIICFCLVIIFNLYSIPWSLFLSTFFLFLIPLFLCGIWLGFTALQIIVLLGKRGTEYGFILRWAFVPFSGVYYPLEVLPAWGKAISKFIPMSYLFEGMRAYVMHHHDPTASLIKGSVLSILYATIAVVGFIYCFNRSKEKGLARLID